MENIQELKAQVQNALAAMSDAQDNAEAFAKAEREYKMAQAKLTTANMETVQAPKSENHREVVNNFFREAVKGGKKDIVLSRGLTDYQVGTGVNYLNGNATPVTIEDVINPAELPSIYAAVGVKIETGVRGQIQWPCLDSKITVAKKGETVAVSDTDLDFSKIVATPVRLALSVAVTNEAIDNGAFDVAGKVTEEIQKGLGRVIDKAMFATTAWDSDFCGPFCQSTIAQQKFAATYPTYAELLAMKGYPMAAGCELDSFAYVMNATTYSKLEGTPITTGDSRMIIENGKIGAYPVYVIDSADMADGTVGAGCFAYVALNQHGDNHFVVDPYSKAVNGEVNFTLNTDWSMTVLKDNAFVVGNASTTSAAATREHRKD